MPTARTKSNLQKTLLILLGIILAVLLTLNAGAFSVAEKINKRSVIESEFPIAIAPVKKAGSIFIQDFVKELSSLK
ncbi:MAG: hypothetical protein AB8B73_04545 [Ekhidna sp.]